MGLGSRRECCWGKVCTEAHCIMIETMSSDPKQLKLRFVLKIKDLKSKVRRINLKLIMLNQLKRILDELFRISGRQYHPTHLYLRAGFSSPVQVYFFLICAGDSAGRGYRLRDIPSL